MPTSPHPAIIAIWAGVMIGLALTVGAYSIPATTSPPMFVLMIIGGGLVNLAITAMLTGIPVYIRTLRKKRTSFAQLMSLFSFAWVAATAIQLLGVNAIASY